MSPINYTDLLASKKKYLTLEKEWQRTQRKLRDLPSKLGFESVGALIAALRVAATGTERSKFRMQKKIVPRKRQKITPEMHAKVKQLVTEGKTGAYIAKQMKISLPSVHNIKKKLGLVTLRTVKN